jgi:ribosomal protein S20
MAKSIRVITKRGRPKTTGKGILIGVRIHPSALKALDSWIKRREDQPSRPEAIRQLVEQALSAVKSGLPPSPATAEKAAELAARAIEKATDKSQPAEEQKTRKRKLIRGPSEFRDIRRDQPRRRD